MKIIKFILTITYILISFSASAQFYVNGDDPGKLKWNYMDTDSYRIIYPSESDSLARVYARKLETFKVPVSRTTGYKVGDGDGKLMPVVLHTHKGSNGSVAWAPRRMDFYTLPSAYDVDPLPWSTMLSVHESRHVTQMQFGMTNNQRIFGYAFGEMWNILVSILYPKMYFIEGDAVVTETALTPSGRGRTADFLNYYRIAFDNGDFRGWSQWLYGSQRNYYPNHYAMGYMTLANIRTAYDFPTLAKDGYAQASKKIFDISPMVHLASERTGMKFKKDLFRDICLSMNEQWQKEDSLRAPFMQAEKVSAEPRLYTNYTNTLVVGNDVYSVKSGYLDTPVIVRIDSTGKEHFVSHFSYNSSRPQWSDYYKRLYWSEEIPHERWSMKTDARIRYMEDGKRKKHTLKSDKNLHSPALMPSDSYFSASVYNVNGKTQVSVISGHNGNVLKTLDTPDSLQIVETAWIGDMLYASAVAEGGFGVYSTHVDLSSKGCAPWMEVLAPQPVKIKDFQSRGDELMFTCDRSGVNELYHLSPSDGRLVQKTNTRYGASDFAYSEDGEYLYFSEETLKGLQLSRVKTDSLINREVNRDSIYRYQLADRLAEQEREIAMQNGATEAVPKLDSINISQPRRYRKAAHMFNIHSWAPLYVSVDNIMNMSFDKIYQAASLGLSGIMQNRLATGVGEIGYSAHKDPYDQTRWRHSGHAKYTYSGLYPVFEFSVDFNDRDARQYYFKVYQKGENTSLSIENRALDKPYVQGVVRTYIPFNLSSGGWYRGVIPQLTYRISNDMFNTGASVLSYDSDKGSFGGRPVFIGHVEGKNSFRHSLTGSIRGYTMLGTPNSAVYPKWGIGLEMGASGNLESSRILSTMGYAYLYGYVPGIIPGQGLKLSAMHQQALSSKAYFYQPVVNVMPRGLSDNGTINLWLSLRNKSMTRISVDYGIPVYIGDWGIFGGFFYFKRLVLTPHFDYMFAGPDQLYSVGCDLTFDLNSLLWLGWPCSVGVTYSYNGGPSFNSLSETSGIYLGRHYIGPTFNVSF